MKNWELSFGFYPGIILGFRSYKEVEKTNLPYVTLYKPQNQKECDEVIELIIKNKIK